MITYREYIFIAIVCLAAMVIAVTFAVIDYNHVHKNADILVESDNMVEEVTEETVVETTEEPTEEVTEEPTEPEVEEVTESTEPIESIPEATSNDTPDIPVTEPTEPKETTPVETQPKEPARKEEPEEIPTEPVKEEKEEPEVVVTKDSHDPVELLACVIYQEAGSDSICDECRYRVADVVLNRVNDPRFPDTIYEVLTAPSQYGNYSKTGVVWPSRASNKGEAHAVQRAYNIAMSVMAGTHSDLYGEGYVWQAQFIQGKDNIYCCGHYFGR